MSVSLEHANPDISTPSFKPKPLRSRRGHVKLDPSDLAAYSTVPDAEQLAQQAEEAKRIALANAETPVNDDSGMLTQEEIEMRIHARDALLQKVEIMLPLFSEHDMIRRKDPNIIAERWELRIWENTKTGDDYQSNVNVELMFIQEWYNDWDTYDDIEEATGSDLFRKKVYESLEDRDESFMDSIVVPPSPMPAMPTVPTIPAIPPCESPPTPPSSTKAEEEVTEAIKTVDPSPTTQKSVQDANDKHVSLQEPLGDPQSDTSDCDSGEKQPGGGHDQMQATEVALETPASPPLHEQGFLDAAPPANVNEESMDDCSDDSLYDSDGMDDGECAPTNTNTAFTVPSQVHNPQFEQLPMSQPLANDDDMMDRESDDGVSASINVSVDLPDDIDMPQANQLPTSQPAINADEMMGSDTESLYSMDGMDVDHNVDGGAVVSEEQLGDVPQTSQHAVVPQDAEMELAELDPPVPGNDITLDDWIGIEAPEESTQQPAPESAQEVLSSSIASDGKDDSRTVTEIVMSSPPTSPTSPTSLATPAMLDTPIEDLDMPQPSSVPSVEAEQAPEVHQPEPSLAASPLAEKQLAASVVNEVVEKDPETGREVLPPVPQKKAEATRNGTPARRKVKKNAPEVTPGEVAQATKPKKETSKQKKKAAKKVKAEVVPAVAQDEATEFDRLALRITSTQQEWQLACKDGGVPRAFVNGADSLAQSFSRTKELAKLHLLIKEWDTLIKAAEAFRRLSGSFSNKAQYSLERAAKTLRGDAQCKRAYLKQAGDFEKGGRNASAGRLQAMAIARTEHEEESRRNVKVQLDIMVEHYRQYREAMQKLQAAEMEDLPAEELGQMAGWTLGDYRGRMEDAHKQCSITIEGLF